MELFSRSSFSRTLCGVAFGSVFATSAAFLLLSSNLVEASDYSVDTIRITVPTSCTLNSTLDTAHTASMSPGEYKTDIGTTTFQVLCNDPGGFDVYAIGYSNDTYGTTTMINSSDSTIYFDTGTGQSGNSQWAMKLTPVSGTYAPTIQNGFNNYHVVPTTYTKVATFASNTDGTVGSKVQSTYAIYVSSTQVAGTYTGKVRYTIVHPSGSEAPIYPVTTNSGYISYNPNAASVVDTMGDQTVYPANTSAVLWTSNFQRSNYGFAGWSDKYDWVLNENDASGNGTGNNAGYHIYGPDATITFTAGQYTGTNPGLSLYAVWVPNQGYMQDFTATDCAAMATSQVTALKDRRDNQVYAVAKLADSKCWMIENLRLAGYDASNEPIELTTTNTHNPLNSNDTVTLLGMDGNTTNHLSAHSSEWCNQQNSTCMDKSYIHTRNITNPVSNMTTLSTSPVYSRGNYYNWYSATAGRGTSSVTSNRVSVQGDICPAGWHLPRGGDKANESNNEYWQLIVNGINGGVKPANYSSSSYPYYTGTTEGTEISKAVRGYPNNLVFAGVQASNSVSDFSTRSFYWTSTNASSTIVYGLYVYSDRVDPGTQYSTPTHINSHYKTAGRSVRCVAGN